MYVCVRACVYICTELLGVYDFTDNDVQRKLIQKLQVCVCMCVCVRVCIYAHSYKVYIISRIMMFRGGSYKRSMIVCVCMCIGICMYDFTDNDAQRRLIQKLQVCVCMCVCVCVCMFMHIAIRCILFHR